MAANTSTTDLDVEVYDVGEDTHYKEIYKILIIGDSNVGKTALLTRFVEGRFQSVFMSTVGKVSRCMHAPICACNHYICPRDDNGVICLTYIVIGQSMFMIL